MDGSFRIEPRQRRRLLAAIMAANLAIIAFSYVSLVAPVFSYLGYNAGPTAWDLRLYSAAIGMLPVLWLPELIDRPSKFVYWLVYLMVIAPAAVVGPVVIPGEATGWLLHYSVIVAGFGLTSLVYRVDVAKVPIPSFRIPRSIFWLAVLGFSAVNYLVIFSQFGVRIRLDLLVNLLSDEVTATRLAARSASESGGFFLTGYSLTWQSGVLNPFLIAYGIVRRSRVCLAGGLMGQLLMFSVAANKSMLISSALVWVAIMLLRERRRGAAVLWLPLGTLIVLCIGALHQMVTNQPAINSLVARRAFMTPATLTRYYIDFFSTNPQTSLSQSVLSSYADYPYNESIPRTVGAEYISETTNANANLYADAFANFGVAGILFFSLILGVLFLAIDGAARSTDLVLTTSALVTPGSSLVNSALLTSMLTHGLILALLLMVALSALEPDDAPAPASGDAPDELGRSPVRQSSKAAQQQDGQAPWWSLPVENRSPSGV